jgi:glycine cleavage system regulatory protein
LAAISGVLSKKSQMSLLSIMPTSKKVKWHGTPLFAMSARVQAPPQLSLGHLKTKLEKVGEELDVDINIKVPLS